MMRTAVFVTLALVAVSAMAMPASAQDPILEPSSNCQENPHLGYRVCAYSDGACTRVSFRGPAGQGHAFAFC